MSDTVEEWAQFHAQLPEGVEEAGGPHPSEAEVLAEELIEYGAERILVFTNDSTGVTSIDFESPLPGDPPQRASVTLRNGQIEEVTLRLGVLDPDLFSGHPTHNPAQVRRLQRTAQDIGVPGGSVVVNYGDDRYVPRPHILVNWVPSVAEPFEIVRREPMEPLGVGEFMDFLERATEAIREEFEDEFDEDNIERMVIHPAKVRPDLVRPPKDTRNDIKLFYLTYATEYARVWEQLDLTRETWQQVTKDEQIALLKLSYMQAVLSVRIPWERAEDTFESFMEGNTLMDAWEETNHGLANKRRWMLETLADDEVWDVTVDLINQGSVDAAHDVLLSDAKGVGDAKAPFTLTNLGFVQKMCIDGNIATLFESDQPSQLSLEEYEEVCAEVTAFFPELSEQLRPGELQWLLFDNSRIRQDFDNPLNLPPGVNPVAAHDVWFRYVPGRTNFIKDRMAAVTEEAKEWQADQ